MSMSAKQIIKGHVQLFKKPSSDSLWQGLIFVCLCNILMPKFILFSLKKFSTLYTYTIKEGR